MLQLFRSAAKTWVSKVLFGLLTLTFISWGIGDIFTRRVAERPVAIVGSQRITIDMLNRKFKTDMEQMRQSMGQNLTEGMAKKLGLLDKSLNSLIDQSLVDQEAASLGLVVTDETLGKIFLEAPELKGENGQFDPDKLRQIIRQNNETEAAFFREEEVELARRELVQAVASGTSVPDALTDRVAAGLGETRDVSVLVLTYANQKIPGKIDEAVLKNYLDAHKADYMTAEQRSVSVIWISPAALMQGMTVSDADIKAAYDKDPARFHVDAKRSFKQVVFNDEAAARAFALKAKALGNIDQAAAQSGQSAILVANTASAELPAGLGAAVFSIGINSVSDPLKSPLGWHVVQVLSETPGSQKTLDQVKEQLRAELLEAKATDQALDIANKLDEKIGSGAPLDEAAKDLGLTVEKIGNITAEQAGADNPGKVPVTPQVRQSVFSLGEGETSSLLDLGKDGYLAVRVDAITPAAPKPFNDVRDSVAAAWKLAQQQQMAQQQADAIMEKSRGGKESLAELAKAAGLELIELKDIARANPPQLLPAQLVEALFNHKIDEVVKGATDKAVLLAEAEAAHSPVVPLSADKAMEISAELKKQLHDDYVIQFVDALRQSFPVQINSDVLDRLRNSSGDEG